MSGTNISCVVVRASHFLAAGETLWTSSTISRIIYHMLAGKIRSGEHAGAMMLFLHDCSEQATANNASKLGDFSAQAGPEPVVTGQNTELERAENVEASERERGIGARASEIAPSAAAQDLPSRCRYSNILLRVCRPASVTLALLCQKSGAASAWRRGRGEPALAGADSGQRALRRNQMESTMRCVRTRVSVSRATIVLTRV